MSFKNLSIQQILNAILIGIVILFIAQNLHAVKVRFLFYGFELPMVVLVLSLFFLGYFTAKILGNPKHTSSNQKP